MGAKGQLPSAPVLRLAGLEMVKNGYLAGMEKTLAASADRVMLAA